LRYAACWTTTSRPPLTKPDPRIDAYIAQSADFAQPILHHLRAVVHASCPDVEETIKWGFPHFMHHGMLCSMASFKAHCSFGFWQAKRLLDAADDKTSVAMGQFGRIATLADLPPDATLSDYLVRAMALNTAAEKPPARPRAATPRSRAVPDDMQAALSAAPAARQHFDAFSPSQQREYIDWIEDAKTATTRTRRLAQAVAWLADGKRRNWKYEQC
jgi:uncharacterized protein YdeI (YjbR/CyaY-like superfamily)